MKKRILSMMLALCMLITLVPMIAAASSFPDMPDDYSTAALEAAVENGLLTGSDGKILPNDNLTRAQMAAIVVRAFGASNEASLASFSDVSGDEWYASYLAKAVHMKVLQGDGTRLMPNDSITRQQAFTILARALKLEDGTLADLSAFSDASSVASWAVGPTAAMVKAGFIHGAGGKLNPTANILRKDFAVMMHNIFKTYITQPGTVSALAEGCVLINVPGVTLKDVTVKGDLVIGDGVGNGDVILENVAVTGRLVVRGGGLSSIIIRGSSSVGTVIVSKVDGNVRVFVEDGADVEVVYIDDGKDDVIVEGEVDKLVVEASDVPVTIKGTVDEVTVTGAKVTITVEGDVNTLTTASGATNTAVIVNDGANVEKVNANAAGTNVSGDGSVGSVNAAANNVNVSTVGTNVTAAPGVSGVKAGDKEVKPGETAKVEQGTTPGTGGGGGGPVVIGVQGVSINGEYVAGSTLTAVTMPSAATVTYKWQWAVSEDGDFEDIDGATGKTYRLVEADKDKYIRVIVTGTGLYTGQKTSAAVGPVEAPDKTIYKITYEDLAERYVVSNLIEKEGKTQAEINNAVSAAISGLTPVQVTLEPEIVGKDGYAKVRFAPVGAGEHIQIWAKDTADNWYDINEVGWGPASGFPIVNEYRVTTYVYILADAAGEYDLNVKLVDLESDNAVIAEVSDTVTVISQVDAAKEAIQVTYSVSDVYLVDIASAPSGLEGIEGITDPLYKVSITADYADAEAAQKSGRSVLTKIEYNTEDVTTYIYDATGGRWYKNTKVWGPPNGYPLSAGDFEGTSEVYFTVGQNVTQVQFAIRLVDADAEWADVVYGEDSFTLTVDEKEAAKNAIKPAWSIESVSPVTGEVPSGVSNNVNFTILLKTTYADKEAAMATGRKVTTYFTVPEGVTVYYPVWEESTLKYKSASGGNEPVAYGMVGHPLSADNIDGVGPAIYVAVDASAGKSLSFNVKLEDAEWDDVVYAAQTLTVDLAEVAKNAIQPAWLVKKIVKAEGQLPEGIEANYIVEIETSYESKAAAMATGRTVTTYFTVPEGVTVYYPVWASATSTLTYEKYMSTSSSEERAYGMVAHPLSAGNIDGVGPAIYVDVPADTEAAYELTVRLVDAVWTDVEYGSAVLSVPVDTKNPSIVDACVEKDAEGNLVLTVQASDMNLYSLEVDHSHGNHGKWSQANLPEFTVYADPSNPWGTSEAKTQFETAGVTVDYDADTQTWTMTFKSDGQAMDVINDEDISNGAIEFYLVAHDKAGNSSGSMYDQTYEKVVYTPDNGQDD